MAYTDITEIEQAGDVLYVLASKNLYAYDRSDQSVTTYSKMDALSDCSIAHIAWNNKVRRLIIVYENENIDLLEPNGNVINMPEYYMKTVTGNKNVNSIYIYDHFAYLATGLGILKLDMAKAEISNTYKLDKNITAVAISGQTIYAKVNGQSYITAQQLDETPSQYFDCHDKRPSRDLRQRQQCLETSILKRLRTSPPMVPNTISSVSCVYTAGQLFTTVGGYGAGIQENRPGSVQVYDGDSWTIYEDHLEDVLDMNTRILTTIDVEPNNPAPSSSLEDPLESTNSTTENSRKPIAAALTIRHSHFSERQ